MVNLKRFFIECIILTGNETGEIVLISRIPIVPSEFFSVYTTINKTQGQTCVEIDLTTWCFSHGQMCVALSLITTSKQNTGCN